MKKRLASLLLLLPLVSAAFAGVPLSFGEGECSMGESMGDMDCCQATLRQGDSESPLAKLSCAIRCAQNGTTAPPDTVRVTPPPQTPGPIHAALNQTLPNPLYLSQRVARVHSPPRPPAYLRNLALLI